MYFGTEFFECDPDLRINFSIGCLSFFGEENLEIPDNLFDFGIPAFLGIENLDNSEDYNLFFSFGEKYLINSLSNFFGSVFYSLDKLKSNFFYSMNRVSKFDELSGLSNLITNNFFSIDYPQSVFTSGITDCFDSYEVKISKEFRSLYLPRFLSGNLFGNLFFCRNISEQFLIFFNFPELILRDLKNNVEILGTYSEKSNYLTNSLTGRFFDFYRTLRLINSDRQTEDIFFNKNKIYIPKNIFSAAAENEFSGPSILEFSGKNDSGVSQLGLNRRIDQLEEIIRNNKKTTETDYDSVVRRLDFELRSALNSCSEGVHF